MRHPDALRLLWLPAAALVLLLALVGAGWAYASDGSSWTGPRELEDRFHAPPGLQWGGFRNADGVNIRYCFVLPAIPVKGTAVLVPGNGEFAEKYFELMRELQTHHYAVWEMDWRGFGGSDRYLSDPQKGHSVGFEPHERDLHQFVTTVVRGVPGTPIFLVAHSMGGNIGLRYLHDHPGRFAFAVLSAPGLSLGSGAARGLPDWVVRTLVWSACTLGLNGSWASGAGPWVDRVDPELTHDPVRSRLTNQWRRAVVGLRFGGPTYGWVKAFLRSCDTLAGPGYLRSIRAPVLLGSASADVLTLPKVQARACSLMPACRLMSIEGAWHELFMEADSFRGPWMEMLFNFAEANGAK